MRCVCGNERLPNLDFSCSFAHSPVRSETRRNEGEPFIFQISMSDPSAPPSPSGSVGASAMAALALESFDTDRDNPGVDLSHFPSPLPLRFSCPFLGVFQCRWQGSKKEISTLVLSLSQRIRKFFIVLKHLCLWMCNGKSSILDAQELVNE
jgi:hypothetical protein